MEGRAFVGLEARAPDGTEVGRISEVITDESSGAVTRVVLERDGERFEVPITAISVDRDQDYATFHADRSDTEPGDHVGDEERPQGYAPLQSNEEDLRHEGQFVTEPQDPTEAAAPGDLTSESGEAGAWQDEEQNTPESGYPRNDAYIEPDSGEEVVDPRVSENETLQDDVEDLLTDTGLSVRSARDGVVELSGSVSDKEALDGVIEEVLSLPEVIEVDTTDVSVR